MSDTLGSEHETDEAVGNVKRFGVEWQYGDEQATAQSEQKCGDKDGEDEGVAEDCVH